MTLGLGMQDARNAWIFRSSLDSQNFSLLVLFLLISAKLSKMKHCLLACILPECQLQGCQMVLTSSEQSKRYRQKTTQKNSQKFTNLDYICNKEASWLYAELKSHISFQVSFVAYLKLSDET